jgi:hypothetical protein
MILMCLFYLELYILFFSNFYRNNMKVLNLRFKLHVAYLSQFIQLIFNSLNILILDFLFIENF